MANGITIKTIVIMIGVILVAQVIPVDAANSDERKKMKVESDRVQDERKNLKNIAKNAKAAWNDARDKTDTAKQTWKNNKTETNKNAIAAAKAVELTAYNVYKQALKDFKNYKPSKQTSEVSKVSVKLSKEKQAIFDAKSDIKTKKDLWNTAKKDYRQTGKDYKKDSTTANYNAWEQKSVDRDTAYSNYLCAKQILKDVRNNVPNSCSFV